MWGSGEYNPLSSRGRVAHDEKRPQNTPLKGVLLGHLVSRKPTPGESAPTTMALSGPYGGIRRDLCGAQANITPFRVVAGSLMTQIDPKSPHSRGHFLGTW